jgi:PAS domain S-box-containing protein
MKSTPAFIRRYGMAVGTTVLAVLMTWVLRPLPTPLPGLILLTAVVGSAAYGGLGPGLLATACALLGLQVLVLPPTYIRIVPVTHSLRLGVFGAVACTVSILFSVTRLVTARLQRVNAELEARVAERTATLSQAHAALSTSEARYRELFENANDIIYTHDLQGYFTSINKAAAQLSGYTQAEALQMHIAQVVAPEHLALANQTTARQLAGATPPPYELAIRTKEGRQVPLELHTRLISHEGRPVGIQGIARDISERKRTEETLRYAKEAAEAANTAKSEFLSTMSHELRTPLTVILGYTAILLEEGAGYPEHDRLDALRRIDRSAHELLDLITAVLDMSRLEAGRLPIEVREVRVQDLLTDVQTDTLGLQEQSGLAFEWHVDDEPLPLLRTDPGKLKIVLRNLLGNAIKFTAQGTVTIRARGWEGGVEISVQDTGIGIPSQALAQIFEPFYQVDGGATRRSGGTGLGLSIVQRLLVLLGGRIRVESEEGSGALFRVWVPARIPAPQEKSGSRVNRA